MNWTHFNTYGEGKAEAFETLCTQLFERYLRRKYVTDLVKFRVINGSGGDGGIEAYGLLVKDDLIAVQAKWFSEVLTDSHIRQIRNSVTTAMTLRPSIRQYFICIPRAINSFKFGRGVKGEEKKPIKNYEEKVVDELTDEIESRYPGLTITWWFEQDIELELLTEGNEGIHRFWFKKEMISLRRLINHFKVQQAGWLKDRYIPALHGNGIIQKGVNQLLYHETFRRSLYQKLNKNTASFRSAAQLIPKITKTLPDGYHLKEELKSIENWVSSDLLVINNLERSILNGNNTFIIPDLGQTKIHRATLDMLADLPESNERIGLTDRLTDAFSRLNEISLKSIIKEIQTEAKLNAKLFLGDFPRNIVVKFNRISTLMGHKSKRI